MIPLSARTNAERERDSAYKNEADGPSRIQIEPAPRQELETKITVS